MGHTSRPPQVLPPPRRSLHDTVDGQPLLTNRFRVLIDGVEVGISAISSLTSETEPSAQGKQGEPSEGRYHSVVLKRALTGSKELYRWREQAHLGRPAERSVQIRQYDSAGESLVSAWELEGAWPRRWSGPALDASDSETIACEELELAYTRLVWHDEVDGDREEPRR